MLQPPEHGEDQGGDRGDDRRLRHFTPDRSVRHRRHHQRIPQARQQAGNIVAHFNFTK